MNERGTDRDIVALSVLFQSVLFHAGEKEKDSPEWLQ